MEFRQFVMWKSHHVIDLIKILENLTMALSIHVDKLNLSNVDEIKKLKSNLNIPPTQKLTVTTARNYEITEP